MFLLHDRDTVVVLVLTLPKRGASASDSTLDERELWKLVELIESFLDVRSGIVWLARSRALMVILDEFVDENTSCERKSDRSSGGGLTIKTHPISCITAYVLPRMRKICGTCLSSS